MLKTDLSALLRGAFEDEDAIKLATDELKSDLVDAIPTGLTVLDVHLGGGLFEGRIYEIAGEESHGKSTLSYAIAAAWQRRGPQHIVHILETESALDKVRCRAIGVDLNRVLISETEMVQEGFESISRINDTLREKIGEGVRVLHIWDTIAAAATPAEREGNAYGGGMAEKPRIIRSALRDLTGKLARHRAVLILINQVHDTLKPYSPLETPGGRGIRHHASVRIMVKKKEALEEDKAVGNYVEVFLKKNKVSMPGITFRMAMYSQTGFSEYKSLVHYLVQQKPLGFTVGGGGWVKVTLPEWLPVPEKRRVVSFRATDLEKTFRESLVVYRYCQYLAYQAYVAPYALMALKYRSLLHRKQLQVIRAWNAEAEKWGGTRIDAAKLPPAPPPLSDEELSALSEGMRSGEDECES